MPVNLKRISRTRKPEQPATPAADPALQRTVDRLVKAERARTLLSDADLDRLAEVTPADVDRAVSLWDDAQRAAGTGLDGLLDAKGSD